MVITAEEKISIAFWWMVAVGITAYLILGIINTVKVIIQ